MAGYWNRPEETANVMTADGYFRTGDIGVMDEQRLHQDRRPQEGHDPGLRLQRLSERDRGSDREPSGRAGMRRDRRPRRQVRRGGEGVRGQEGPERSRPKTSSSTAARSSPATRCPSRSSSGPTCRRPMSARSCAANCATRRRPRPEARARPFDMTDARASRRPTSWPSGATPAADRWYTRDDAFDAEVRRRYLGLWRKAAAGELSSWETSDDGALALVIVLDQFPRNMFRGDAPDLCQRRAGARGRAAAPSSAASTRGSIRRCANSSMCPSCIRSISPTRCAASSCSRKAGLAESLKYAEHHADIIRRFGRFPHRNRVLGRATHAGRAGLPRRRRLFRPDDGSVNGWHRCRFALREYCAGQAARSKKHPLIRGRIDDDDQSWRQAAGSQVSRDDGGRSAGQNHRRHFQGQEGGAVRGARRLYRHLPQDASAEHLPQRLCHQGQGRRTPSPSSRSTTPSS